MSRTIKAPYTKSKAVDRHCISNRTHTNEKRKDATTCRINEVEITVGSKVANGEETNKVAISAVDNRSLSGLE